MSVFRIANPGRQSVGHLLSHKESHHSSHLGVSPTSGSLCPCLVYWFSTIRVTQHALGNHQGVTQHALGSHQEA